MKRTNKLLLSGKIFTLLILVLIYLPLLSIVKTSFNYGNPINTVVENEDLMSAIYVSIYVTVITVIISVVVALLASVGLSGIRKESKSIMITSKFPLIAPDIIIALGMSMFLLLIFGKAINENGQHTRLIIAHVSFAAAYAFIAIYPVARRLGKNLTEAAHDLGAGPFKTLVTVVIPNLKWAIISGATIAFVMSFDDYIISKMAAPIIQNISIYFYSARRIQTVLPSIYSLTAIMVIISLIVATLIILVKSKKTIRRK